MNETGGLISVSEEERARIRAALQAYMRAHRIGVPRLCGLVIDSDPRQREMPLSTLQRFLRGKHRTGDAYVAMCAQFLEREGFTAPEERDPLAEFGGAMAGFWSGEETDAALVGSYVHVEGKDAERTEFVLDVSEVPNGRYMKVVEQRGGIVPELRYAFEGVLVRSGVLILIAMRETLSGLPRTYWLERLASPPEYRGTYLQGHCHVVWSRIDVDRMKAVHLSHDRSRLMDCAVQLARKFGLELPPGLKAWEENSRTFEKDKLDPSLAEKAQAEKSGITPDDRRAAITQAYEQSDTAEAFRAALSAQGYVLARGDRRAFVVVDEQCDVHSLTRYVKGHKARDIKAKLASIELDDLPDVDAAKELIRERQRNRSQHGDGDSGHVDDGAMVRRREEFARDLQRQHEKRRAKLRGQTQELLIRQQQERMALHAAQAKEQSGLFFRARRAVADMIGKTPALRSILAPLQKLTGLDPLERHKREGEALVRRHEREKQQVERKERFLARIEQREAVAMERTLAALEREDRALSLENAGTEHSLSHYETRQRRLFERGNLQVEFNDAGEFAEGIEEAGDGDGSSDGEDLHRKHRSAASNRPKRMRSQRGYRRDET